MTAPPRPNPDHVPPKRLTSKQVCDLFRVSPHTLARWNRQGRLKPVRTGGYRNEYDAAEVQALIAAATVRRQP